MAAPCCLGGIYMSKELIIVLDFGGQYNQLIARRVRECNVYCEILPYTTELEKIKELNPQGIIFTGGPNSVYDESSPHYSPFSQRVRKNKDILQYKHSSV